MKKQAGGAGLSGKIPTRGVCQMKTSRDIKMSLDIARTRNVPCRTTQIEDQIKKDLISTRGCLLTESEVGKIEQKEDLRIKKQARAITRARINILRQKERTKIVQAIRKGNYAKKGTIPPAATGKKVKQKREGFNAIDVSY
jgi:hypothetical protein